MQRLHDVYMWLDEVAKSDMSFLIKQSTVEMEEKFFKTVMMHGSEY